MKQKLYWLIFMVLFLALLSSAHSAAFDRKPVELKSSDKCPVCGMFVAKYRNWLAEIIFRDGTYAVFDGPKDMFRYYQEIRKYNASRTLSDISTIYVTEYYTGRLLDARTVFFVYGSDVYGPMGAELVPLADERSAKEFLKDHKGSRILRFDEVTREHVK